jgi:hypothetical protein
MKAFNLLIELCVALFLVGALLSLPVMLLWDWLMPTIFGLPEITWFQAWGLLWLTGFLFRSGVSSKD